MKILICGVGGRMGREVAKLALDGVRGATVVAGFDIVPLDTREFVTHTDWSDVTEKIDCIIDFSHHTATTALLNFAIANRIPTVIATTGHTDEEKEAILGEDRVRELERAVLLQSVDRAWMEHIDAMDDLKDSIRLQSYAQRDPVNEYRIQGADMFDQMVSDIRENTTRTILSVTVKTPEIKRVQLAKPLTEGFEGGQTKQKRVTVSKKANPSVGRNDLCPCGSGKKYKKCCGAPTQGE